MKIFQSWEIQLLLKTWKVRSSLVEVVFEIRVSLPMGLMLQVDPVPL